MGPSDRAPAHVAVALPTSTATADGLPAPPDDSAAVGRMIDAIGGLIQLVGVYAHDTDARSAEETRRTADRWRRHLTTGLGHPDEAEDDAPDARVARGGGLDARDWEGAVRFASTERRAEHVHVSRTQDELRETVWTMVRGLHVVVGEEAEAGRTAHETVRRLEAAIVGAEPDQLRGAALAALGEIGAAIAQRDRQRATQIAELGRQVSSLGAALEDARRDGATDPLTGLGNRRAFDAAFAHAVTLHGLWEQRACVLLIDLDRLKQINDGQGHAAGDAALQTVAHHLSRTFMGRTDLLARIGGDEFAVLLRDATVDEAERLGERLAGKLGEPGSPGGVSIGGAALLAGEHAEAWFARADAALYEAKRAGGGRVAIAR